MIDVFETLGPWENVGSFKAAVVLLKDHYGRILLQFRDDFSHVKSGGRWGYFGGEIEEGETPRQAVIREIVEEIGVPIPSSAFHPFVRILSTSQKGHQHYVFICNRPISPSEIKLAEGAGFAFLQKDQLDQFDLIPVVRQVVDRYFASQAQ